MPVPSPVFVLNTSRGRYTDGSCSLDSIYFQIWRSSFYVSNVIKVWYSESLISRKYVCVVTWFTWTTLGETLGQFEYGRIQQELAQMFGARQSVISKFWESFLETWRIRRGQGQSWPSSTVLNDEKYLLKFACLNKILVAIFFEIRLLLNQVVIVKITLFQLKY